MGAIIEFLVGLAIIWGGLSLFLGPWISSIALIAFFVIDIIAEIKTPKKDCDYSDSNYYYSDSDCYFSNSNCSDFNASEESFWWSDFLPEYYTSGESRTKTLCGYQYSNGTDSYINPLTGVENRSNGISAVPTWYDSNIVELYNSTTGEYMGTEVHYDWGIETYDN